MTLTSQRPAPTPVASLRTKAPLHPAKKAAPVVVPGLPKPSLKPDNPPRKAPSDIPAPVSVPRFGQKTQELITAAQAISRTLQTLDKATSHEPPHETVAEATQTDSRIGGPRPESKQELGPKAIPAAGVHSGCAQPARNVSSIFQMDDAAGDLFRSTLRTGELSTTLPKSPVKITVPFSPRAVRHGSIASKRGDGDGPLHHADLFEPIAELVSPLRKVRGDDFQRESHLRPQSPAPNTDKDAKLIAYLERDNAELRARLAEAQKRPESTADSAALMSELEAMKQENRRLREERDQQEVCERPEASATVGFLRRRVQTLEEQNKSLERAASVQHVVSTPCTRCPTLETDVHRLQMQTTRNDVELRNLTEQNAFLKGENKRLRETEEELRRASVQAIFEAKTASVVAPDQARSPDRGMTAIRGEVEEVLHLIERELGRTRKLIAELEDTRPPSTRDEENQDGMDAAPILKRIQRALGSLSADFSHPNMLHGTISNGLDAFRDMIGLAGTAASAYATSVSEARGIDVRIDRLRREGARIREMTERAVEAATKGHEDEVRELNAANEELVARVQIVQKELEEIKKTALEAERHKTHAEAAAAADGKATREPTSQTPVSAAVSFGQNVRELQRQGRLDAVDTAAILSHESPTAALNRRVDDLTSINFGLQSDIKHLEATLAHARAEVLQLRATRSSGQLDSTVAAEAEQRHATALHRLHRKFADQKLQTEKANAVIANLRGQVSDLKRALEKVETSTREESLGGGLGVIAELERTLREKIQSISIAGESGAKAGIESKGVDDLIGLLKENQDTAAQLAQLAAMVDEHVTQLSNLRATNADLNAKLTASRARLKTQETTWLSKFQSLQADLTGFQTQHESLEAVLQAYVVQYQSMLALDFPDPLHPQPADKDQDHPYPFLQAVKAAHASRESATARATTLQSRLTAASRELDDQRRENDEIVQRYGVAVSRIGDVEKMNETLREKVERLADEVRTVGEGRRKAEIRLAKIVVGYKTLVAPIKIAPVEVGDSDALAEASLA
ncbi:hypothetical protein HKX48_001614 [Thoreauomyces humboldtii]|nr:hypothetical protein HKX48_001614 [Thoreauomyces humboldtii]